MAAKKEAEAQAAENDGAQAEAATEDKKVRSTISFPYGDLDDAVQIARALHDEWGGKGTVDQVGATLKTSMKSGAFRSKIATAKTFGVIRATDNQMIELTSIGKMIVDSQQEAVGRVKAFLAVPLYEAIYRDHKQDRLPPIKGLESLMVGLGVIPNQVDKARQAFQRSAKAAGFFKQGEDRLVIPVNPALLEGGIAPTPTRRRPRSGPGAKSSPAGTLHPDVDRLMATFLREGADWSAEKQQEWLGAVRNLDRLTQEEADDGKQEASP